MFKLGHKIGLVGSSAIKLCEGRQLVRLEQDAWRPAKTSQRPVLAALQDTTRSNQTGSRWPTK